MRPLSDNDASFLCGGTKNLEQDSRLLSHMLMAAASVVLASNIAVLYRVHPTALTVPGNDAWMAKIDALLAGVGRIIPPKGSSMPQDIAAAKRVVWTGLSSELLTAAHAGIAGVYYGDEEAAKRNHDQGTLADGLPIVVSRGGFLHASNPGELREGFDQVFNHWGNGPGARQRKAFPPLSPNDLGSAALIARFLVDNALVA